MSRMIKKKGPRGGDRKKGFYTPKSFGNRQDKYYEYSALQVLQLKSNNYNKIYQLV